MIGHLARPVFAQGVIACGIRAYRLHESIGFVAFHQDSRVDGPYYKPASDFAD